jgi:hypothetical protein
MRAKPRINGSSAKGCSCGQGVAAAAKGVADLVSSRQVSQHGLEYLGRARRVRLLVPPELARVATNLDRHVHPIVGEQRRLERAPQRRDDHSLRAEATNRTLPRRGLHPTQLGQRRVGHVAPRRVGFRLPVPQEEDTTRPARATTVATGLCHGRIPSSFFGRLRGLVLAAHPNRTHEGHVWHSRGWHSRGWHSYVALGTFTLNLSPTRRARFRLRKFTCTCKIDKLCMLCMHMHMYMCMACTCTCTCACSCLHVTCCYKLTCTCCDMLHMCMHMHMHMHMHMCMHKCMSCSCHVVVMLYVGSYTRHTGLELDTGGMRASKPAGFSA